MATNPYTQRNIYDLGIGQIGAWVDPQTGLGYSGPKRKATDISSQTQVGQEPTLNRTPITSNYQTPSPVSGQTTSPPQVEISQFDNDDPIRKFNLALLDMLKKAQSGETQMGQEKAQLTREAYRSGQEVFTGEEAKMTPEAKMAALNRNVGMYEPSIQAATTKIQQLRDITDLMKTTYGEDFSKLLPVTEEDAQVFKQALRVGMTLPADILTKYGKYFTTEDWASWSEANKKGETTAPTSYREWELAGGQSGTGKTYAEFIQSQKAPTANQEVTALYANRLEQAESVFEELDDYINGLSTFELFKQQKIPNSMRSVEYQKLDQAQRNFINATLRRESGAAIADSEFENARNQYFIQPGDKPETIAQKKLNRQQVIDGFISGSGNAYAPSEYLSGETLRDKVISLGYDYDAMIAQGYSEEEIRESLGL